MCVYSQAQYKGYEQHAEQIAGDLRAYPPCEDRHRMDRAIWGRKRHWVRGESYAVRGEVTQTQTSLDRSVEQETRRDFSALAWVSLWLAFHVSIEELPISPAHNRDVLESFICSSDFQFLWGGVFICCFLLLFSCFAPCCCCFVFFTVFEISLSHSKHYFPVYWASRLCYSCLRNSVRNWHLTVHFSQCTRWGSGAGPAWNGCSVTNYGREVSENSPAISAWRRPIKALTHSLTQSCDQMSCYRKPVELSLIHIWRCRRDVLCRSRWSPYH